MNVETDLDGITVWKPYRLDKLLFRSVDELELPSRPANWLSREKIDCIGDLVTKTEEDLLRVGGLGRKSVNDIKKALEAKQLSLGMDLPVWPPEYLDELTVRFADHY